MIKAICFDVGEVLIRLDPSRLIQALGAEAESTPGETLHRLGKWAPYDQFERGVIGETEFLRLAQAEWGTRDPGEFLAVWNSVLVAEIEGVSGILSRLKGRYGLFGLTNSNPIHIAYCREKFPCMSQLEHLFTSYEIGARKPEKKAFDFMLSQIKMAPDTVLFFDDRLENIEAARGIGMKAEWVRSSPGDVETYLKSHRVI